MTNEAADTYLSAFDHRCHQKVIERGQYNNSKSDFFAKFRQVAKDSGHPQLTMGSLRHQIAEKYFRMNQLLSSEVIDKERIDDTLQDLVNYVRFLAIYLDENFGADE